MKISNNSELTNQTTFSMRQKLKSAEIIQRRAKNVYSHISPYEFKQRLNKQKGNNLYLLNLLETLQKKISIIRSDLAKSVNPQKGLIEELKNNRLGNGGEEVNLATIVGKMNGQRNIYSGTINGLDHGVSFITNKIIKNGEKQSFKDKEAVIIDPQLGITDYVGNYFAKLKEIMGESYKRNVKHDSGLAIVPRDNHRINKAQMADLKANYPELLIDSYIPIKVK